MYEHQTQLHGTRFAEALLRSSRGPRQQTVPKLNNIDSTHQELLYCCFFDEAFSNIYRLSCDYLCVTFVSLLINLRNPRDFTSHTSRRGTLHVYIYIYPNVVLRS